ncbi:hypothetical protein GY45DRAFT_1341569, partial [Cubamyces sp. BRFM 1775]
MGRAPRTPRTPRPPRSSQFSARLRQLCWTGAYSRQPYDTADIREYPCTGCCAVGKWDQSITYKEGRSGQWHRLCLCCHTVEYPSQPPVPQWLREEICFQHQSDRDLARETKVNTTRLSQHPSGADSYCAEHWWWPTSSVETFISRRDASHANLPLKSAPALSRPRHEGTRHSVSQTSIRRTARRLSLQHCATPGPSSHKIVSSNSDIFGCSPEAHDTCAFDEEIARKLQQELDEE